MNYAAEDCPVNRMRDPRRRRLGGADALRALPVPGLRADAGSPADDGRGGRDGGGAPGGLGDTVLGSGRAGMRVSKFDRRICRFLLDGIHDSGGRRPPRYRVERGHGVATNPQLRGTAAVGLRRSCANRSQVASSRCWRS